MASESIGAIYPTEIPGYADNADIQAAFRLYHYGSTEYNTSNTNTDNLSSPSIAFHLNALQEQIDTLVSPREKAAISTTAATGTVHLNVINGSVHIYTANATANYVLNVRVNSSSTLNSVMAVGESITVTFEHPNGSTPYYATAITIDGSAPASIKWLGGTAPTAGNANSTDVYMIQIRKTASATFTCLASQSKFA
jgi:hypothetical protein